MSLSLIIVASWIASWVVFLGLMPQAKMAGIPLFAWSQLLLSAIGVVFSMIAIPMFEKWEKR
jgi:hypothetical protein